MRTSTLGKLFLWEFIRVFSRSYLVTLIDKG
jgi:hypothetical protein